MKVILAMICTMLILKTSLAQDLHEKIDTSKSSLNVQEAHNARIIVASFSNLLFRGGDLDSLLTKCSIPLIMDGEVFKTRLELGNKLKEIIKQVTKDENTNKDRGIRVSADSTEIFGTRKEILNGLIPLNVYFVVNTLKFEIKEQVAFKQTIFAVQMSDSPKIIGITAE